jgi:hypothetical protein
MGINWANLYLGKKIKLKEEEKDEIFSRPAVRNLSLQEVIRIVTLGDKEKISSILAVYASDKFNGKDKYYSPTHEEKGRIIGILYGSKGDMQFKCACSVFCSIEPWNLMGKTELIEESVTLVANAKHGYQARYAGNIAIDRLIQRHERFISIIHMLSILDKEKSLEFYDYIRRLEDSSYSTVGISNYIDGQLNKYAKLMAVEVGVLNHSNIVEGDSCGSISTSSKIKYKKPKTGR